MRLQIRFLRRILVPLPDKVTRRVIITSELTKSGNSLEPSELEKVAGMTAGFGSVTPV